MCSIDPCDETRIAMFAPIGSDLSPEIKKIMNSTKYKWKAQYTLEKSHYEITVFGRSKPNSTELPIVVPFRLKAYCFLQASREKPEVNQDIPEEMGHIGNRQIFLNSLLGLIGRLEKAEVKLSDKAETPLQREISDTLNLMNQTQSFSFPNMKDVTSENQNEVDEFCRHLNIPSLPLQGQKVSVSYLDVNFR